MPIYSYQCQDCGHDQQDMLVKSWSTEVSCPICHNVMTKLPSCGSFQIEPAVPKGS